MTNAPTDELKAAEDRYYEEVRAIATKGRTEIVVPICRKYQLSFTSYYGTMYFWVVLGEQLETIWDPT